MTTVTAMAARVVGPDSFTDLTGPEVLATVQPMGNLVCVTFDGDLTEQQVAAIRARMTSRDDTNQAARANLAELLASDTTASPLSRAVAAYLLGDA